MISVFNFQFTREAMMIAILIFILRALEISLDTLRMLFTFRGKKVQVWVIGFIRSAIFVVIITYVLTNLENPLNMIAYAAGFATGNILGMWLEERMALGFVELRIVSTQRGQAVMERLREKDFAVTEFLARGKDGMVSVLGCTLRRKYAPKVEEIVREVDEDAFITAEDVRSVKRGFWGA
ncbi:MAG: DUF2179 domain-containing protein [Anaerolineales bacterium]|nr:DUF2179 domain-containing protein [Anaerolineales bacterium]